MSDPIARICLLLAATDERQSDLRSFARWVDQVGPQGFVTAIERIRGAAELAATGPISSSSSKAEQFLERLAENPNRKEMVAKVEQLLLGDTGLPKSVAATMLIEQLVKQGTPRGALPSPQKVAFATWLRQVADRVPESVVLHVATRLRNELAHGQRSRPDWALKKDTE